MKKVFLLIIGLMLLGTTVYAQTPKTAGTLPGGKAKTALIERAQGKIVSLQKADEAKANFGGFSIIDTNGKKKAFELFAKSRLYAMDATPISLENLKKGDQVIVLYVITLKGMNSVITVTQTK